MLDPLHPIAQTTPRIALSVAVCIPAKHASPQEGAASIAKGDDVMLTFGSQVIKQLQPLVQSLAKQRSSINRRCLLSLHALPTYDARTRMPHGENATFQFPHQRVASLCQSCLETPL